MRWLIWRQKGLTIGLLWGILAWIPYFSPYLQSIKPVFGLPAALGLTLETAIYRLGGPPTALNSAYFLSVPFGALLGYCLSLPGQGYWRRQEVARQSGGVVTRIRIRRRRGALLSGRLF